MEIREKILETFLRDVANHKLTIINDNGLNRHIRLSYENSSAYYFDIITWNGYLTICGDMGTYVFSRLGNMFEFFRHDISDTTYTINPSYWGEKLKAVCRDGDYEEFSRDRFKSNVKSYFDISWDEEYIEADKNQCWGEIESAIRYCEHEYSYYKAINNFEFEYSDGGKFTFQDFWEYDNKEYSFHYIWCCYAIVYAIRQYDKFKLGEQL